MRKNQMTISDWALRWGIPPRALADLQRLLTEETGGQFEGRSEESAQANVRNEAAHKGMILWRNNVGAYYTEGGALVRYGLANDSKQLNDRIKSSDLIGLRPVLITPEHVGQTLGQFVAREMKAGGWRYRGTKREKAQLRYLELVTSLGGDAKFATGAGTL